MSTILFFILLGVSSAQFNSSPAVSELNGAATLSWQIPAGELPTGPTFYVISPAGLIAFILTSSGSFTSTLSYTGRVEFHGDYTSRNITFTIKNIRSADAGTYGCQDTASDQVISDCGQMLVVLGKPTKPSSPSSDTTPVYNEQMTLTCRSTSTSIPQVHGLTLTYTWERDGIIVAPDTGTAFTFNVISRDPQNFRCRADESRGLKSNWSDVYTMEPEYGPYQVSLTPPGLSYTVRENRTTIPSISCSANCKPACTLYSWEKNGTTISNSAVLNLGQSSRSQTGLYRCRAVNVHNSAYTAAVIVDVQYLDGATLMMDKSEVVENESVGLQCSAVSHPTAMLTVRNVDNDTVVVQQETDELTYTIPRAQCLHNGSFVCSAEHKAGGVLFSNMVPLNVLCSPRIDTRKPMRIKVSSGLDEVAFLLLNVISNPAPTFRWYLRYNQQLVPIPNITQHEIISTAKFSVLQIRVTHSRDYASYVVEATSNHVTFTTTFNLLPTGSNSQECVCTTSDRLGMGILIGVAAVLPVLLVGIIVYMCCKRCGSQRKQSTGANQGGEMVMSPTHQNENRATYSGLTPTPGNEYEELKL